MPKVNRKTDRAHVIISYDLNQGDFDAFVSEIKQSKFFPNLIGIEVKRPNFGNPVIGLGALILGTVIPQDVDVPNESEHTIESDGTDYDE